MSNKQADHLFDVAARKFDRSLEDLDQDVKRLEEWLEAQPHLPKILDKNTFRNFLILNKGSVEIAKQKIDNYFTVRTVLPEVAYEMNPKLPHHKELNEMGYFVPYPEITNEMYKIYYIKIKAETIPDNFHPLLLVKRLTTMQELRLREEVMCGDLYVMDFKGFTLSASLKFTPMLIYRYFTLLYEKVLSARFKGAHIINMSPPVITMINLFKSILKEKLAKRINVLSEADGLKKIIPINLLPVDFGGQGLSLRELQDALDAKYAENKEFFDNLDQIKVDESLRPDVLENDETLGFYGNFKKLNID